MICNTWVQLYEESFLKENFSWADVMIGYRSEI
jgi:hypothetical protein